MKHVSGQGQDIDMLKCGFTISAFTMQGEQLNLSSHALYLIIECWGLGMSLRMQRDLAHVEMDTLASHRPGWCPVLGRPACSTNHPSAPASMLDRHHCQLAGEGSSIRPYSSQSCTLRAHVRPHLMRLGLTSSARAALCR